MLQPSYKAEVHGETSSEAVGNRQAKGDVQDAAQKLRKSMAKVRVPLSWVPTLRVSETLGPHNAEVTRHKGSEAPKLRGTKVLRPRHGARDAKQKALHIDPGEPQTVRCKSGEPPELSQGVISLSWKD